MEILTSGGCIYIINMFRIWTKTLESDHKGGSRVEYRKPGAGKQNGGHAGKPAAADHGDPHCHIHAGPGALQCGGQRLCGTAERGCAERRVAGLSGAESDDRRGGGHRCGHQRPAVQEPGRGQPGQGGPHRDEWTVPQCPQLSGVCSHRPDLFPPVLHHPDGHPADRGLRRELHDDLLCVLFRRVLPDHTGADPPGHRPYALYHVHPGHRWLLLPDRSWRRSWACSSI